MASEKGHLLMFPWLAFGHLLPFLEFSKKLAAKGVKVSFVSTPKNLRRLPSIPSDLSEKIKLLEVPLPSVDGLPENSESTIDIQPEQTQYLKKAYDGLAGPMEKLLQNEMPDLILVDFLAHWVPEIATKVGVPVAFFSAYTAATLAFLGPPGELISGTQRKGPEQFTRPPDWFTFPSLVAHSPHYAPTAFQNLHIPDKSGLSSGQRIAKVVQGCSFIALKSCKEFEAEYIHLLEELYQRPVIPVGVLPPVPTGNKDHTKSNTRWSKTFEWLDRQKPKSVLFVGFGSEYKMPTAQIQELAHAIELSGLPFIWILRTPEGAENLNLLLSDFPARTSKQGMVCPGWAPQMEILAHSAIGGCLFHSGWGSIIECLGFGHPLVLMPMVYDQTLNAKLLTEKGVGYEVPRNLDGSFNRKHVADAMRLVMVEPQGEEIRSKATQMQTIFGNQDLHDSYINEFIQHLRELQVLKTT
ncbi:OLC1v1002746C2 [Oldenlandia corymbosa var. corymbosa]|nr:OLC1v1002746C2 [Oldenlandia corymbosa var. corymbosa]